MYTEDDLRTTLGALEREAPDVDEVLAGLDRLRRRRTVHRRTFGMAAAAVLVAAVTAGSVLVTGQDGPRQTAEPPGARSYRLPFEVGAIPGYQVVTYSVVGNGESTAGITTPANIAADFPEGPYTLRVFEPGEFEPAEGQAGEQVRVNGKSGFYREDMPCLCGMSLGVPSVVWEYAADSWALVRYPANMAAGGVVPPTVRETLMSMATAVRFDRTTPIRLPFRVGYLPADLRPSASNSTETRPVAGRVYVALDLEGPGDRSLSISTPGFVAVDPPPQVGEPVVVDGVLPRTVTIDLGEVTLAVSGKGYTDEELKKVATSIRLIPDVNDPRTWLDAEDAIPLH